MAFSLPTTDPAILCNKALADFRKKYAMFKGLIDSAKSKSKIVSDALRNLTDKIDLPDLASTTQDLTDRINGKIGAFNDFVDAVNAGDKMAKAFEDLVKCLGSDAASKYLGITLNKLDPFPNPGKLVDDVLNTLVDSVDDVLSELGNDFDGLISKGFDALERTINQAFLDDLLKVISCLETFCETVEAQSTTIESKMESIGLNIHGKVDFTSTAFAGIALSSSQKNYASSLTNIANNAKNTIRENITTKNFSPTPPGQENTFLSSTGHQLVRK